MKFKYQSEFDKLKLTNCPPSEYKPLIITAYRFMFQDPLHPNNFKPAFLLNPPRVNDANDMASKCQGFGLSLFQLESAAKDKFEEMMVKTRGNFAKLVGDQMGSLALEPKDEVGGVPNLDNYTHFTFHESMEADLTNKIISIEKI
jgi:hypothetical protein